jgi:hypothetical protein
MSAKRYAYMDLAHPITQGHLCEELPDGSVQVTTTCGNSKASIVLPAADADEYAAWFIARRDRKLARQEAVARAEGRIVVMPLPFRRGGNGGRPAPAFITDRDPGDEDTPRDAPMLTGKEGIA